MAYYDAPFAAYNAFSHIDENSPYNKNVLPLQLEYRLKNLPIYQQLAHPSKSDEWLKLSSWENLDRNVLELTGLTSDAISDEAAYDQHSMTDHTLAKPGGILIKPVTFYNVKSDESVSIFHVGYKLCGYPLLVHGGMIATMLNEAFKRNASLSQFTSSNIKDDFMVEHITINYKKPTRANQFLTIRVKPDPQQTLDPKQVHLQATIESEDCQVLVTGKASLYETGRASNQLKDLAAKAAPKWWRL